VADLAQAWGVEQDGEGKTVWCEFAVPSGGREPAEGASRVSAENDRADLDVEALLAMYGGDDDEAMADPRRCGGGRAVAPALVGVLT
jgi:hypothetical protein